MMISWMLQLRR